MADGSGLIRPAESIKLSVELMNECVAVFGGGSDVMDSWVAGRRFASQAEVDRQTKHALESRDSHGAWRWSFLLVEPRSDFDSGCETLAS